MLFGLVPYEQVAYELVVAIPAQLLYAFLIAGLLDIRFKRVFWSGEIVLNVFLLPFRTLMSLPVRLLIALAVYALLPLATSRGGLMRRVAVCLASMVLAPLADGPGAFVFAALTGLDYTPTVLSGHLGAAFLSGLLSMVTLAVLFTVLRMGLGKLFGAVDSGFSARFALPACVAILQPIAVFVIVSQSLLRIGQAAPLAYFWLFVVGFFETISVLLLYVSAEQYAAKQHADLRAQILQDGLDAQLASYGTVVQRIEETAHLRHDLRNQMQTVEMLEKQGQRTRAKEQVREMISACRALAHS